MSLNLDQIKHIARLARIELSPEEAGPTLDKLNGVFALIEQMQAVDTTGVEPMSHPQDVHQRLRVDQITESNRREAFQRIAPQTDAGLYLVPKVIE